MSLLTKKKPSEKPDMDTLIEQVLAEVADLRAPGGPGEPVRKLASLRDELTTKKGQILTELQGCTVVDGDRPGSRTRFDPAQDAEALIGGVGVESLTAPAEETRRGSLLRQLRAIEAVLPDIPSRIASAELGVVQQEFQRIKPALAAVVGEILRRYQLLQEGIEALAGLEQQLNILGLRPDLRQPLITNYELQTVHGDNRGRPQLDWWVRQLRENWGLDQRR